ncbi:hypothetical protein K7432_017982 [Basidiobolus ranarum]|uniref:Uncharacterized protein n=1 Tax=Basidiobolus ranarum TaxID=34480 RepID=A0ABR2WCQ1_9FUNG
MPSIRPPTPGKPCSPKSCKAIITKIRTVCGTDIDINFCLNLSIDIDLLRLERLKCRVIVGAAQLAGVRVSPGVCNLLDGRIHIGFNERNHFRHNVRYGHGYGRRSVEV